MTDEQPGTTSDDLTSEEKLENVIRLAFNGDRAQYEAFRRILWDATPSDTAVVLRGSAVTGERWKDGAPFDADGSGTSDLDLTLVGNDVIGFFKVTGFFVPGVHSRPMGEDDPDIAPDLVPLRERLMQMVNRPVNIQASREMVMYLRGELLGQPYHVLFDKKADGT
ncbi:hypothetical protein BH23ACI1_BH23ACI1_11340 [soil metagenome]